MSGSQIKQRSNLTSVMSNHQNASTMAISGTLTELDFIKQIVKEVFSSHQSLNNPDSNVEVRNTGEKEMKKQLFKLYIKIWMALCKFIRSQCDKGRMIDTRLVGQFYKKNQNQTSDQQIYVFVPSVELTERGKLRLMINNENEFNLQSKQQSNNIVKVNYQSIASVCDCKTEVVQTFMARFKDLMLESIEKRQFGNCLCLNLKFGLLTIQKSGEIEFKNFSGSTYLDDIKTEVTFKSRATAFHSQARSQQNTIDSNLRQLQTNMQYGNMQSTGNGKIAMMTVASPQQQNNISLTTQTNFMNSRKLNSIVNRSFASPSGPSSMINSNKKLKRNDYNLNIQQSGRKLNQNQSVLIPQQSHGIDGQQQNDYLKEFLNTQQNYFKNDLQKVRGASSQNLLLYYLIIRYKI